MSLKEIILQLVQIAIFFAFPTIWNWIITLLPWWPLDPQNTLNLLVYLGITLAAWILGLLGIKRLVTQLKTRGFAAE
ncbi:hypothetical protein EH223_16525 [candidate division KSB1 bacterium]|nr:hypothetical protein [candidate division KSB1 bacterium]RQW01034.1 MAG: hypothetical protein EH223_16525 [candidate division KSB1 bacterium]